ncbi:uncharacterized protein BXZ73DRAFT_100120 [Epithele typhae]|uniref:uncharacterized protein n=1 Tax=Epithele typhae TaxID=378194 RepID=UPI002007E533|nr:uncharacterized protein BXZ73DRAFT_100120 [Epithele typhae]KAH9937908.1 hypothetical protein BXZ73DRAFT_100120 [Epithele typhae]
MPGASLCCSQPLAGIAIFHLAFVYTSLENQEFVQRPLSELAINRKSSPNRRYVQVASGPTLCILSVGSRRLPTSTSLLPKEPPAAASLCNYHRWNIRPVRQFITHLQMTDDQVDKGFTRADGLWYEDGTVIFVAGNVGFRVYKGLLSSLSPVFEHMFSSTQPDDAETI